MKKRPAHPSKGLFGLVALACLLSACFPQGGLVPGSPGIHTPTPFQPIPDLTTQPTDPTATVLLPTPSTSPTLPPTPSPTPTLQPTPAQIPVWVDPALPEAFHQNLQFPPGFEPADAGQEAVAPLRLQAGGGETVSRWIYALVAPFPTIPEGVSAKDVLRAWADEPTGPFAGSPLLLDESTYKVFSGIWGKPTEGAVQVLPGEQLLDHAWSHQPAWALVPFEALEPRWKVLEMDGGSPLRKDFDAESYPLSVPISLSGDATQVQALLDTSGPAAPEPLAPPTNRRADRMTILAMTGVTALVRATANTMEQRGVLYPGKDVREVLRQADVTHISNEVPFAENCPSPDPMQQEMRFCSDPRYIALLEDVGADVIELTGDHFQDWGEAAMLYTLELYRQHGWPYYGGGANLKEGRQPVIIEHNGNRLAFIGCNAKGGAYAQASKNKPGAVRCEGDWMEKEIAQLRQDGYLPVATFQHYEYYTYKAQALQKRDFPRMAQAGAVIVSGSQAHQPQAFAFDSGALIHYGLGNLFFDQYLVSPETRKGFIDLHIFYDGRYISTEFVPILFIDFARPRPMNSEERAELLRKVFKASGW